MGCPISRTAHHINGPRLSGDPAIPQISLGWILPCLGRRPARHGSCQLAPPGAGGIRVRPCRKVERACLLSESDQRMIAARSSALRRPANRRATAQHRLVSTGRWPGTRPGSFTGATDVPMRDHRSHRPSRREPAVEEEIEQCPRRSCGLFAQIWRPITRWERGGCEHVGAGT